jgi:hypothetical protein
MLATEGARIIVLRSSRNAMPVQLGPVASTFLVIFYVVSSLALIVLIGVATYLVLRLNRLLELYQSKIDPILVKADHALTIIADKADSIGGKAESLLAQSEEVAEAVHEKVDKTAIAVQRTINAPIISANSLVAGIKRGFWTFARLQQTEPTAVAVADESGIVNSPSVVAAVPPQGQSVSGVSSAERLSENRNEILLPLSDKIEKQSSHNTTETARAGLGKER